MAVRKRICCIVGTRPEAIKMAPVVLALRRRPWAKVTLLGTGQHQAMVDETLDAFKLRVDETLDVMRPGLALPTLAGRLIHDLGDHLRRTTPAMVVGQGDTTSAMAAAFSAFHEGIPFAHVEAGLRTGNLRSPFPEEFNRRVITLATSLHFPPTDAARRNLLDEGVDERRIVLSGNPVVDALRLICARAEIDPLQPGPGRTILLTAHRRENVGAPHRRMCQAVVRLIDRFPDVEVVCPVHPNPAVAAVARAMLGGRARVHLCPPLAYPAMIAILARACLVLTDSGGLQEEGPALGKPVLILRDTTERPEAVDCGAALLVGTDEDTIVAEASRLLDDPAALAAMARPVSPFGDGHAAGRIVDAIRAHLGIGAAWRPGAGRTRRSARAPAPVRGPAVEREEA